jgi:hypothetical protein
VNGGAAHEPAGGRADNRGRQKCQNRRQCDHQIRSARSAGLRGASSARGLR